jgi:hypothetical protein
MRAPTMIRGEFRLRYRIRNKIDKMIIIDHKENGQYVNGISTIDVGKCSKFLIYKLLDFVYIEWYKEMYDFFDRIDEYDSYLELKGMVVK